MRILYYDWDEVNGADCRDAMRRLGHEVDVLKFTKNVFDLRPEIDEGIRKLVAREESGKRYYDLLFSFGFLPNISEVCQKYDIPYVSWVFDSPHYPLDSHQINNPVNRVFVFDRKFYEKMLAKGVGTIHYSPLGVNHLRLQELCKKLDNETGGKIIYEHDVCFLGNLYDNEYNFYDQVKYLPPYLKGYMDAVIKAQEKIFGLDLFSEPSIVSAESISELRKYIKFENSGKYEIDYDNVIRDILRKKVTVNERREILRQMGKRFDTVLYTMPGAKAVEGVCNLGVAEYMNKMPRVFHRSKINLNITLRTILSGIPLRVIDVLAAGGFLITNYQEEIAENFIDGEDLVIAYTPEDMIEKTAYYLEHEEERQQIALNGQKKVMDKFAYTKLLPEILNSIR